MQEEVHPHNVWKVSNGDRTILREKGGWDSYQYTFANKVFYQGKHVVEVKLDVYEEKGNQFVVGACFESIVHELKDGDYSNAKGKMFAASNTGYNYHLENFSKLKPKQGSSYKMTFDFIENQFKIECDDSLVGTKQIQKGWKLVPYIWSSY